MIEPSPTILGILGAIVMASVGTTYWIVRRIIRGELVPVRYLDQERERSAHYQEANDKLISTLREVLTDKDLGLHMLSSLRAQAQAQEGDET